jgi:lipopolysaccharide/colanic/teichoic acid biosynthesis glycosyltransferase
VARALWELVASLGSFSGAAFLTARRFSTWPALIAAVAFWWGMQWGTPESLASFLQPVAVGAGLALLAEAVIAYADFGAAIPLVPFFAGCAVASFIAAVLRARERAALAEPRVLESVSELPSIHVHEKSVRLVVPGPDWERRMSPRALLDCKLAGIKLETGTMAQERSLQRVPVEMLRPVDLLWPDTSRANRPVMAIQAIYSNLIGLALLIGLSPVLVVLAVLSRAAAGSGPFFEEVECAGFQGIPFSRRRFRVSNANGETTGIGAFLMRLRLTGLPQLINLVRGEMALFGPQPVRLIFSRYLDQLCPVFSRRLSVKPGIFGWAQANSRNRSHAPEDESLASFLQEEHQRISYDLYYLNFGSPLMDLEILVRSVFGAKI